MEAIKQAEKEIEVAKQRLMEAVSAEFPLGTSVRAKTGPGTKVCTVCGYHDNGSLALDTGRGKIHRSYFTVEKIV